MPVAVVALNWTFAFLFSVNLSVSSWFSTTLHILGRSPGLHCSLILTIGKGLSLDGPLLLSCQKVIFTVAISEKSYGKLNRNSAFVPRIIDTTPFFKFNYFIINEFCNNEYDNYIYVNENNYYEINLNNDVLSFNKIKNGNKTLIQEVTFNKDYNYGNLTTGSSWTGRYVQGNDHNADGEQISQRFRAYDSMDDYVKDEIQFLTNLYEFNQDDDFDTFIGKLQGGNSKKRRYAEDKQYSDKVRSVYNSMKS